MKLKIAILGKGNVGTHLARAFSSADLSLMFLNSRKPECLTGEEDIVLLAVSDSAIIPVAEKLAEKFPRFQGIVAHLSGSLSILSLAPFFKNYGVFYPLQTFSKCVPISDLSEIPIFIEGSSSETLSILKSLASVVFRNIYEFDSDKRLKLHLASVFACNFVNAMYSIAEDILLREGIPFEVLHVLISQTAEKVLARSPIMCQTGPAVRGDMKVIDRHLDLLRENPELADIYSDLTSYIKKKHLDEQN